MITKINRIKDAELINKLLFNKYDCYGFKDFIHGILLLARTAIKIVLKSMLYSFLINALVYIFTNNNITADKSIKMIIFIILSLSFATTYHIINFDKDDYFFIKLLNVDRKKYVKAEIINFLIMEFICIFGAIYLFGMDTINALFLTLVNIAFKIIMELFYLHRMKKSKFHYIKSSILKHTTSFIYICIFSFGLILLSDYLIDKGINSISVPLYYIYIFGSVLIFISIFIVIYLIKKYNYKYLFNKYLTKEMYDLSNSKVFAKSVSVGYSAKEVKVKTNKKGLDYLYYLFNRRYARSLITKVLFFGLIIGGTIVLLYKDIFLDFSTPEEYEEMKDYLYFALPLPGIFFSLMSMEYLKLCYSQLDSKLQSYNFYKKHTFEHMKHRFVGAIIYDALMLAIMYGAIYISIPGMNTLIAIIICCIFGTAFNFLYNFYFYFFFNKSEPNRIKVLKTGLYIKYGAAFVYETILTYFDRMNDYETSLMENKFILYSVLFVAILLFGFLDYKHLKAEKKK